jgi:predicted metal-dependent peptidase
MFNLNTHTARLLMDEPFFAAISRRIDKKAHFGIPTAGVRLNPETAQFEMLYNPDFFAGLDDKERADVLKHEFYHVVFLHVTDRMPDGAMTKMWNIATDLAINSHLHHLPEGALIPGKEGTPFRDLPRGKSAEWYLRKLPDLMEEQEGQGDAGNNEGGSSGEDKEENQNGQGGSQGNGEGESDSEGKGGSGQGGFEPLDDHSGWAEAPDEIKEIAKERLKDIIKKASEECSQSNGWGTVSSDCRERIMKGLISKIDWKKVLRYFIKTSQRANKSSSMKRINRRYPYCHPGRKTNRVAKVAVSIDQSGSVDNVMLAQFFAELNKLSELAEFTVIPFDTKVGEDNVYVWKKGEKRKWERVMHGGTCFDAPTDYVNQRGDFDGHIILTDLCAPKPKASKCQRMWMTTPQYAKRPYFSTNEKIIAID